ncbi:MAG: ATPase, T2SS/T4P/T4SS family [Candidatus Ozemobacteraceae bacterium]
MSTQASKRTIEELMLEKKILTEEQLEKAKNIQTQTLERLEDILIRLGLMSERDVLDLWAGFLGITVVDLTNLKVDAKILGLIPEYQAKQYKMIPLRKTGNKLTVAMADPFDIMATDMIAFLTQCKLDVVIAPRNQIEHNIKQLYSWEGFSVAGEESMFAGQDGEEGTEIVRRTSEEGPVVQFLNAVFKQAILKRASDIHIEPRDEILLIRFRIDGTLHDAMTGPKSLLAPLISRVKILAYLDIAERRLPQDGRLKVKMEEKEIDFRVSTVPSLLGEKAVLRMLARESAYELDNIGFLPEDLERLKVALDEPYGMILVTGPTGAGKTTTLFGMLKYFTSSEINIFTIENPVEYRIDGITQVQINEKIGLDFSHGLRAALRQDPDIILVGEIRDLETAEIGFRASLTGHKVLSTLHTNNAPASINRLINMGVPPYLVTAAVRVVIAQKLLHRICPHCKVEYRPSQKIISRLKLPPSKVAAARFYKGTGCKECNLSGGYGRLGVYETMIVTQALRDVVMEAGSEAVVKRVARLGGMKTMREIALAKAFEGLSTLEEVLYVTPSDEETAGLSLSASPQARSFVQPIYMPAVQGSPGGPFGTPAIPTGAMGGQASIQGTQGSGEVPVLTTISGLDPNDPVFKSVLAKLEEDFLFFADDELANRYQLSETQVQECLILLGQSRTIEGFQQKYGKLPGTMDEDEATEMIRRVQERQGRLPDFIFGNPDSAQIFAKAMTNEALKNLAERDPNPDALPALFTEEFTHEAGLDPALDWAGGSRFALLELVRPGRYKPWQVGEGKRWAAADDANLLAREALDWMMTVKLGCSRGDLPGLLTSDLFKDAGLDPLLARFNGSIYQLVQAVYPSVFKPWQFPEEESRLWFREDRLETAKDATRWLVESRLSLPVDEVPKVIGLKDFHQHGLSNLLDLFNQSLFAVIENAYPGRFKPWEFAEQGDLWRGPEALTVARDAVIWLIEERLQWQRSAAPAQLTRRHFLHHGLGFMLGSLFNHSPLMAIENVFPELKTDEIFQKSLIGYAQEVRDLALRWSSQAEKIAVNQFGKARFKVTLPNLKIAPILPENERLYFNAANQIEYVPQIVVPKLSAYDDFTDVAHFVPACDRLIYWILTDDRAPGYVGPSHPKVKLVFAENLVANLRSKGLHDVIDKIHGLRNGFERLLDRKAPLHG